MFGGYAVRGFRKLLLFIPKPISTSHGYSTVAEARAVLENELNDIRSAGTWKVERVITSKQGPQILVDGSRNRKYKSVVGVKNRVICKIKKIKTNNTIAPFCNSEIVVHLF